MSLDYNPLVHGDYVHASKNISSQHIGAKLTVWAEVQQQFKSITLQMGAHKPNSKQYLECVKILHELGAKYVTHCLALEPEYLHKLVLCAQMFAAKDAKLDLGIFRKALAMPASKPKKTNRKK